MQDEQQQPALISIHRIPGLVYRPLPNLRWTSSISGGEEREEQVSLPQEWNKICLLTTTNSFLIYEACQPPFLQSTSDGRCLPLRQHQIIVPKGLPGVTANKEEMDSMLNSLGKTKREATQLMMDRMINPMISLSNLEKENNKLTGLRSVEWSPLRKASLFVVLTLNSHILFYHRKKREDTWTFQEKQSNQLMERMRTRDEPIAEVTTYSQARDIVYRTFINCISWSKAASDAGKGGEESCLFIAGSKSGRIFFFRVSLKEDDLEVTFIHALDTKTGQLNCLQCVGSHLFVGTESGQVFVIRDVVKLLSVTNKPKEDSLHPEMIVSEADGIPANIFIVHPKEDGRFILILPKMTFTLILDVSLIRHSLLVSKGADTLFIRRRQVVELGNKMPPTDLRVIKGHPSTLDFLMSAGDGRLVKVSLKTEDEDARPILTDLKLEGLFKSHSVVSGIASSLHGNIFAILQQIVPYHDSKLGRDSSLLAFYSNISFQELDSSILDNLVMDQSQEPISLCLEYMLAFRGFLDTGHEPSLHFMSSLKGDLTGRSESALKVSWMRTIAIRDRMTREGESKSMKGGSSIPSTTSTEDDSEQVNSLLTNLNTSLVRMNVDRIFSTIDGQNKRLKDLTPSQKKSLVLLSLWYKNTFQSLPKGLKVPKASEGVTPCPICKEGIGWNANSCRNSHVFTRCSYSLLLCDPLDVTYDTCFLCHNLYITPSIWPEAISSEQCPFCF